MAKKRKRKRKNSVIPKDWSAKDGILTLPDSVRRQVQDVFDKLNIGESLQDKFFDRKLSIFQRQQIGYELNMAGVTYPDIARLLGLSLSGAFTLLQRAFAEAAEHLPQNWLPNNFVDDYYAMKQAAQLNKARSMTAVSEEAQAAFGRNEITARGKAMDALLKAGEIVKGIKQAGKDGEPDASDRETALTWAYETIILPKLAGPKPEEAEIVDERPRG